MFPHHQSNAAAAKGSDEERSDASSDEKANNKDRRRGRSKERGSKRSQTPGTGAVCISSPRVTGSRGDSPVVLASSANNPKSCLADKHRRRPSRSNRKIRFGKTEIFDRPVTGSMTHFGGTEQRDPNYRHSPKKMESKLATQCAVDRAEDLME